MDGGITLLTDELNCKQCGSEDLKEITDSQLMRVAGVKKVLALACVQCGEMFGI